MQTYYFRCGQILNFHPVSNPSSSVYSDSRYGGLSLRLKCDWTIYCHLPFLKIKYMVLRVLRIVRILSENILAILSKLITDFCYWLSWRWEAVVHIPHKREPIRLRFYSCYYFTTEWKCNAVIFVDLVKTYI